MPDASDRTPAGTGAHLLLYDGVCGLCNRVNRFVLRHDAHGLFDFASLQSATGRSWRERLGERDSELTTFHVVEDYRTSTPAILSRSAAALFVAKSLGFPWRLLTIAGVLPAALLDAVYDVVARYRFRLFGRFDTCPLPSAAHRERFIDI
jgi:predicted DCC family thiol-disulfide oxidoreductase YuxK